jgi:phospholipid/cholesterol/gamma-HCH transport system substrate-binding protein
MESRANYAAIGLFVLVMLMTGLGFLFWLTNAGERARQADLRVVFNGTVTGLNTGSAVLFNGIKVGEVAELQLDRDDPNTVIAIIRVDRTKPIRTDTRAILSYQGLTGVANLQLEGGSRNAPLLLDTVQEGGIPTIQAEVSPFQDIMESAKNVLNRADSAMAAIDDFIAENGPAFNRTVNNVETFSKALADNADGIDEALNGIAEAGQAIAGIADDLKGTASRAEEILNAVDPAKVASLVDDLTSSADRLDRVLVRAEEVANGIDPAKVNAVMDEVAAAAATLNGTIAKADAVIGAVQPEEVDALIASIRSGADRISAAAESADRLIAAVDPAKVDAILANVDTASKTFADVSTTIGDAVTSTRDAMTRVGEAASTLNGTVAKADAVIAAVNPEEVQGMITGIRQGADRVAAAADGADKLIAAVDTAKVDSILANVDTAAKNVADVSASFGGVVTSTQETMTRVGEVVGAVDPAKVRTTVDDVSSFASTLRTYGPEVQAILADAKSASESLKRLGETIDNRNRDVDITITNARNLVAQLNGIAERTDRILVKVNDYVEGDGEGLISEATATLASIRQVAETLNKSIGPITANVTEFTDRGLDSFTDLANQGRQALSRLDRVLAGVERNPQQFIFGGEGVPEYAPRRR